MAAHCSWRDSCCSVNIVALPKHEQFSNCASVLYLVTITPKATKPPHIFTIFSIKIEVKVVDMQDAYQLPSVKK